jgi:hypothetical protein
MSIYCVATFTSDPLGGKSAFLRVHAFFTPLEARGYEKGYDEGANGDSEAFRYPFEEDIRPEMVLRYGEAEVARAEEEIRSRIG